MVKSFAYQCGRFFIVIDALLDFFGPISIANAGPRLLSIGNCLLVMLSSSMSIEIADHKGQLMTSPLQLEFLAAA